MSQVTAKTVAFVPNITPCPNSDTEQANSVDFSEKSNEEEPHLFPGLYPVVFVCLKQESIPRIWCLRLVANPWFERVSMLVIMLNCVTLGLYQPCAHGEETDCTTQRCILLQFFDHFVFAFFAVEMLIKMLAMGIWGRLGYLGEAWNRLDCFIVVCGMIEYTLQMEDSVNFTAVRTIRVLRPLRAINRVPSMRILVMLLLDTLPMLGNVLLLCSFVFFIFGVVAVQLWEGTLRQRCFLNSTYFDTAGDHVVLLQSNTSLNLNRFFSEHDHSGGATVCSLPYNNGELLCSDREIIRPNELNGITCSLNISSYVDGDLPYTLYTDNSSINGSNCIDWNQYYDTCRASDQNPFQNAINFDNIMYAWVAIFQVISLEGWTDIMYYVMDGYSFYSFIYFIFLIVIGSFFMINLCLVVIATQFSETKQREQRLMEEQRLRFKSNDSTLASYAPPGNCYEETLKYISHLWRKNKRRMKRKWFNWRRSRPSKESTSVGAVGHRNKKKKMIHFHHHHHHHHHHYHISDPADATVSIEVNRTSPASDPAVAAPPRLMITDYDSESIEIPNLKNAIRLMIKSPSQPSSSTSQISMSVTPERRHSGDVLITSQNRGEILFKMSPLKSGIDYLDAQTLSPPLFNVKKQIQSVDDSIMKTDKKGSSPASSLSHGHVTSDLNCACSAYDIRNANCFEPSAEDVIDQKANDRRTRSNRCSGCSLKSMKTTWRRFIDAISNFSAKMKRIVNSKHFNRFIMIAILINTLSMGIEHHNQPKTLTDILEISNVVFTTLFALEMASKLIAYGILGYTKNLYNVFDAVVVIISVWEIAAGAENGGGLSVLRTFRLLRVLKLVRFLPALRRQLVVLMRTMDNVATFMMLLTLFIFIFSILGMHLFGCEFCWVDDHGITECDRKNFDSLLWAFVTVFQILTQEDWNIVLYNGMSSTSPFASIYFITLMTIGNYVLFNLLVAILVEGFQAECYPELAIVDDSSDSGSDSEDEEDDDVTMVKQVGEEYTKKMANALGLKEPLPTYRHKKKTRKTHGASDAEEYNASIDSSESEEEIGEDKDVKREESEGLLSKIVHTGSSQRMPSSYLTVNQETTLPVITRTAATPLSTPVLQCSPDWLDNKPRNKTSDFHENVENQTTRRRLSFSKLSRKSSEESNLSVNHRELSRTGSKRLLRWKKIPLEEQSLVSNEEDSDGYCENDDMYSNCSYDGSEEVSFDQTSNRGNEDAFHQIKTIESVKTISFESGNENSDNNLDQNKNKICFPCWQGLNKYTKDRQEWSLYLFSPDNKFRKYLLKIVQSQIFDNIVLLFIFGNCVTIALERPSLDPNGQERFMIDFLNNVFTAVFTVELMLKVIAKGLCIGPHTYLKSGWNVLDFFLVTTSLIDILMTLTYSGGSKLLGILRIFRLLRALRPLRVINRAPGLKLVVQTLISSLKPIGNIVLICCAFFIIFGILGVQVFKGKFYYCDGPYLRNITTYEECVRNPENKWLNQRYNFDDLGQALMSLFVLSSKDGWVEIMYHGIDAVGVNMQPQINHNPWMLIYFISFLLIVGFFVLNMFVGVVVENFHRCREEHEQEEMKRRQELKHRKEEKILQKEMARRSLLESGEESSTPSNGRGQMMLQVKSHVTDWSKGCSSTWRKWKSVVSKKISLKDDPRYFERYSRPRKILHSVCMSKYFEVGVSIIIGINIFTMGAEHYQQSELLTSILKYANYGFTAVFVLEAFLKIIALGVFRYFSDKWNQLDMLIVILSLVGIVLEDLGSGDKQGLLINPTIIRVMRVLRIARVLKLLKISKGIRSLLETVACALPQVGNLGMLFLLLFFIFAALGVELFGTLVCNEEHPCEGLNRHATFNNFGIALLTLFRISTGDNWNGIMKDTLREDCDESANCRINCCPSKIVSPVFFVVFVMMAQFVLVNVVVAVLMKQLEDSRADASETEEDNTIDNIQEVCPEVTEADKYFPSNVAASNEEGVMELDGVQSVPGYLAKSESPQKASEKGSGPLVMSCKTLKSPSIVNSSCGDVTSLVTINTPSYTQPTMHTDPAEEERITSTSDTQNFASPPLSDKQSHITLPKTTPCTTKPPSLSLCSGQLVRRKHLSLPISDFSSTPLLNRDTKIDGDGDIPVRVSVARTQSYDRNYSKPLLTHSPLIRRSSDSSNPSIPNPRSCHTISNKQALESVTTSNKSLEQPRLLCNNDFKNLSDGFLNESPKLSMKHPMFTKSNNVDLNFIDEASPIPIKKFSKSADKINCIRKASFRDATSLSDEFIRSNTKPSLDIKTSQCMKNKFNNPQNEDKRNSSNLISSEIRRKIFSTNVWPAVDKTDQLQPEIV